MIYNEANFPELPHSWASLAVDDSVDSAGNSNKKLKTKDALDHGRFPVIDQGQSDISGYSDDESLVVEASESSPVILFGDHTRILKQILQPFVPGADGTKLFRAKPFWDARFVYQMLRAVKLPDKGYARHFQYLRDSVLPLPPLPEQKRIAVKLDAVLARVDACRVRLDHIPAILKRFRQSVLAAATSGKLTEDWRLYNARGEEWRMVPLSDVASSRLGKMLDKAKNQGTPTPYLRNINVRWFGFNLTDIQQIKVSDEEANELTLRSGDVLICEGGEPGRCAIWAEKNGNYIYQKALHRVRVSDNLMPEWLCYTLKDAADSGRLSNLFTGTTIKHLTGIALKTFEFKLPSLEEQTEIVRRVEALFAFADRLEARHIAARAQIEKLTPATLAKALRGELVPQDPNDEPASALLNRIKLACTKSAAKPQGKRTSKKPKPEQATTVALIPLAKAQDDTMKKHSLTKLEDIAPDHLASILHTIKQQDAKAVWSSSGLSIDDFYVQLNREISAGLLRVSKDDESRLELVSVGKAKG